jgi:hypothetical protein
LKSNKLNSLSTIIKAITEGPVGGDIHLTAGQLHLPDEATETVISTWAGRRFVLKLEPLKDYGPAFDIKTGNEMSREDFLKRYPNYEEPGDYLENRRQEEIGSYNFAINRKLTSFQPKPLDASSLIGRKVIDATQYAGSYGQGGPGFFAIKFGKGDWLVFAIWGCFNSWFKVKDKSSQRIYSFEDLDNLIFNQKITEVIFERDLVKITFSNKTEILLDKVSVKNDRIFKEDEDLRKAIFLCPEAYDLYV